MSNFIVYNSEGKILRTGSCPISHVEIQANEGEFVMLGDADDALHMIVDEQVVEQPTPEPPDNETLVRICQNDMRTVRGKFLAGTDWTQMTDSPLANDKKSEYAVYRQALRDLPVTYENETDLANVVYPTPPEA
jgi:hypothetical protein